MGEIASLKILILKKLIRGNIWGGKHTPLDFIRKSIPEYYRHTHKGQKALEEALKELENLTWIILVAKRTGKGSEEHLSLNPRMVGEIKQFLESIENQET